MIIALNVFLLLASIFVLAQTSLFLVHSLVALASYFRLNEFSIAFILMAIATTLPEMFVGITAALTHSEALVLGNALGSNIVNLTLVFGIVILASGGIHSKSVIARRDAMYMFMFTLAPVFLLVDSVLSRGDAVVLIIFYMLYIMRLLDQRKSFHEMPQRVSKKEAIHNLLVFAMGAALLIFSAQTLVYASKGIAAELGLSIGIVGLLIVALGTSLPELAFQLRAGKQNDDSLVLGNLIGSVVANSTLVLAITALVRPINIQNVSMYITSVIFLGIVLVLFEVIVRQDKKLGVVEGLIFIFLYIFFLITEFGVGFASHAF